MSGHLDGPPPGPPDPPYIPGDLGAPSAEEFARRRASPTPEERNPYAPSADWKPGQDTFTAQAAGIWSEGFAAGRAAERERILALLGSDEVADVNQRALFVSMEAIFDDDDMPAAGDYYRISRAALAAIRSFIDGGADV